MTKKILENAKNQFSEASELDGFEDLKPEDQEKITKAWEDGTVADEDIPESARKPEAEEGAETDKPKKAAAKKAPKKKAAAEDADEEGADEDEAPKKKASTSKVSASLVRCDDANFLICRRPLQRTRTTRRNPRSAPPRRRSRRSPRKRRLQRSSPQKRR